MLSIEFHCIVLYSLIKIVKGILLKALHIQDKRHNAILFVNLNFLNLDLFS